MLVTDIKKHNKQLTNIAKEVYRRNLMQPKSTRLVSDTVVQQAISLLLLGFLQGADSHDSRNNRHDHTGERGFGGEANLEGKVAARQVHASHIHGRQ